MTKPHPFPSTQLPPAPGADDWPVFAPGHVWLVGAGPGDPGLMTLHGLNALRQADVIVYDALVDERILAWRQPACTVIYAGKRGGKPSPKQRDISLRLVSLARDGKRVLRLKGGDPYVFGRGGEEAQTLVEAGIPIRVVPGLSAGVGGLAYAGIPVTHRDVNQTVTFVTGHDQSGAAPSAIDWHALAKSSPVIVLYMAMKHLAHITGELITAGRSPTEPVAIVTNATLPTMRVLETTLSTAADDARRTA
ncbi:MAG: uroporphyrinogen-III C-methyltransferase, partial [Pseudomonadota bacterium]